MRPSDGGSPMQRQFDARLGSPLRRWRCGREKTLTLTLTLYPSLSRSSLPATSVSLPHREPRRWCASSRGSALPYCEQRRRHASGGGGSLPYREQRWRRRSPLRVAAAAAPSLSMGSDSPLAPPRAMASSTGFHRWIWWRRVASRGWIWWHQRLPASGSGSNGDFPRADSAVSMASREIEIRFVHFLLIFPFFFSLFGLSDWISIGFTDGKLLLRTEIWCDEWKVTNFLSSEDIGINRFSNNYNYLLPNKTYSMTYHIWKIMAGLYTLPSSRKYIYTHITWVVAHTGLEDVIPLLSVMPVYPLPVISFFFLLGNERNKQIET